MEWHERKSRDSRGEQPGTHTHDCLHARIAPRIQVGAAAAVVLATVAFAALSGALNGRDISSSVHFLNASSRPAYLDSSSYEQRLIREARAARDRAHSGSAVAT
jgi:hypothetical protein